VWEYLVKKIFPRIPLKEAMDPRPAHRPEGPDAVHPIRDGSTGQKGALHHRTRRKLKCPACGGEMEIRLIGKVEIDQCPACEGIFLDRGELAKLKGSDLSSYSEGPLDEKLIYTPHGLSSDVRHADE